MCSGLAPRPSAADLRPSSRRTGPVQEPSGRRQDLKFTRSSHDPPTAFPDHATPSSHGVSMATKPRTGEHGLEASASEPLAMTKGKGAASVSTDDKVARE